MSAGLLAGSGVAGGVRVGRRGTWRLVAGGLVTVATAAGFGVVQTASEQSRPVLVVARPVAAGEVITAGDVRVVEVEAGAGVETVPAGQVDTVVGAAAATALMPGSLLSPSQVGVAGFPAAGEAVVGLPVEVPPAGLGPGVRVRVLITAPAAPGAGGGPVLLVPAATATVVWVGAVDAAGVQVVSLLLDAQAGEQVAAAAAVGATSLVVVAAG
jgi:hypothetical protein